MNLHADQTHVTELPDIERLDAEAVMSAKTRGPLYEARKKIFPKRAEGAFRRFKWIIMAFTLGIYYLTPWLRWDRGPYAPSQAVLIDLDNRRFFMFDIEIWPHEFYFVAGLLIMAGIGLFLVTSAVGRAWCGYACPQTVWTDLFQHIDRFVDGDRNARIRLDQEPWGPGKIAKRSFKWSIYLLVSLVTGGAWILYFADAPTLLREFFAGEADPVAYITVGILTLTTFTLGGFMREQVCIYMCPWPRIQSAMLDEKSLLVTYKDWRGEPRGSVKKAEKDPAHFGDCIDCLQCVAVCPTGIDIREGPQIGCITCALCIDACDRVMAEVGRPRGLIDPVGAVNEVAGPRFQPQPVECGGAQRVGDLLAEVGGDPHFLLEGPRERALQFALGIGLVEHRDDQAVLGAEVVADERVVDACVACDLAHAQAGVAGGGQAAEGGVEDACLGVGRIRVLRQRDLTNWFNHLVKVAMLRIGVNTCASTGTPPAPRTATAAAR